MGVGREFTESLMTLRPAVFLDRDGTLNVAIVQSGMPTTVQAVQDFRLFDGVSDACRALKEAGFLLVVVSNQPDVGRGQLEQNIVEMIHDRLSKSIPEIDRIEVCYDSGATGPTRRRKPEPGMLLDAAAALGIDLSRSWMIGDRWRDVDCGKRAGTTTIFIDAGYHEQLSMEPDYRVRDLPSAVAVILGVEAKNGNLLARLNEATSLSVRNDHEIS